MNNETKSFLGINQSNSKTIIWIISIGIPLIVATLFQVRFDYSMPFLPYVNAVINSVTLMCILLGLYFIKQGNQKRHWQLMTTALFLSIGFLLSYLLYHASSEETSFGGEGWIRYIYFFLLITHIILSAIIVPLVLVTFLRAKLGEFEKHRKIAKYTFVIWTYVLVSGIAVFFMIEPYYGG
jgi:putative membrane protein